MPNLLAMSFEGELAPSFTLHCLDVGRTLPDGWGLGYYPAGEPSAAILKEPAPTTSSRAQRASRDFPRPGATVACGLMLHRCRRLHLVPHGSLAVASPFHRRDAQPARQDRA